MVQMLNSDAVVWSLAKELYGPGGPYFIVPLSLLIGIVVTILQWLVSRVCSPATFSSVTDNTVEMAKDWSSQG